MDSYVSVLLEKADTALYKAKSSGRNQAISYEEILNGHGRIIEQIESTKIVALDIGANVGVTVGQEFKVFLPKFSGREKFHINDGRTKRVLGTYPRVESARIVIFNAQPELSFAFIVSPEEPLILDVGSHLEAIPAGSIGHLLPSAKSSKYFSSSSVSTGLGGIESLQEYINKNEDTDPFAIVIRFSKGTEFMRKHGAVSLNLALAQLYQDVQLAFHAAGGVEVISKESICIVGVQSSYKEDIVTSFIDNVASKHTELNVIAGVFCAQDKVGNKNANQQDLKAIHAIEFARFAAVDAGRSPDNRVRHFNYEVAYDVLRSLKTSKLSDIAYADYKRLRSLGVDSPRLNNLGGVTASTLGFNQDALECYASAIALDPSNRIFRTNYGTVAFELDEIDSALEVLSQIPVGEIDELKALHEFGYFGYARLLAKACLTKSTMFDRDRFLLIAANVVSMDQYQFSEGYHLISKALAEIKLSID
jgi:tetratricopeptide (TPR) repeat protein